ncbi:CTSB, partial [Cordylochernes scorpioides]
MEISCYGINQVDVVFRMKELLILAALIASAWCSTNLDDLHPMSDEYIEAINNLGTTWKAGRNYAKDTSLESLKKLCGTIKSQNKSIPIRYHDSDKIEIPESYDVRQYWSICKSVNKIRDQGACRSCYAHAAVEAMSDRICIASMGENQVELSANDLISCGGQGCESADPIRAWIYWQKYGIVSGGGYNGEGCQPYLYAPCKHEGSSGPYQPCGDYMPAPSCKKECIPGYKQTYAEDKHYGIENSSTVVVVVVSKEESQMSPCISITAAAISTILLFIGKWVPLPPKKVYLVAPEEKQIQMEILLYGPVEVALDVYEDMPSYKSGIYKRQSNNLLGGHALKMMGWGVENGVKYWILANSWNTYWGDN